MSEIQQAWVDQQLEAGLVAKVDFVPFSQSRNAKEKQPTLNWRITLRHRNVELVTDYQQGIGHLPGYPQVGPQPSPGLRTWLREEAAKACETRMWTTPKADMNPPYAYGRAKLVPPPPIVDVFACLIRDADALDFPDFESWASELGWDTDSRSAYAAYQACLSNTLKLRAMIDLDEARGVFEDY